MIHRTHVAVAALASLALWGCGDPSPDKSAVAATVNGKPITVNDLKLEEAGPGQAPVASDPALDAAALKSVIDRRLMAAAASDQKLDKTADYDREAARAVEGVKAATLARKLIASTPEPSADQIDKFIAEHPRAFSERKFLVIDQLQLHRPQVPLQADHAPQTLADFEALLDQAKIPHERRIDIVDTGAADPKLLERLSAVAPHALFQVSTPGGLTVNQILETHAAPLTGAGAVQVARNYLRNQAAEAVARGYLEKLYKSAGTKVQYSAGYSPPSAPPSAPPPAR